MTHSLKYLTDLSPSIEHLVDAKLLQKEENMELKDALRSLQMPELHIIRQEFRISSLLKAPTKDESIEAIMKHAATQVR